MLQTIARSIWYTDGSCTECDTRLAFTMSVKLVIPGAHPMVFQTEVLGKILVVQACGGRVEHCRTVTICLDSQAVIKAIQAHISVGPGVMRELERLYNTHQVNLVWVSGHS